MTIFKAFVAYVSTCVNNFVLKTSSFMKSQSLLSFLKANHSLLSVLKANPQGSGSNCLHVGNHNGTKLCLKKYFVKIGLKCISDLMVEPNVCIVTIYYHWGG